MWCVRILFVNEKCGYLGGVEQNVADAAAGLRERGHVCGLAYGAETDSGAAAYGALFDERVACVDAGAEGDAAADLADVIASFGPDVVYYHRVPSVCAQALPPTLRTVRMVHDHDLCCPRRHKYFAFSGRVCRHGADWRCWLDAAFLERGRGRWPVRWRSIGRVLREMRANRCLNTLLVGSRFMQEELIQNGFDAPGVHVLPPVVRMDVADPPPLPAEPGILYVGQLIRGKGVDLLLRALHALRAMRCTFQATIIGSGNAELRLKALCQKLGLGDQVRFGGWVPHDEIGRCYAEARVLAVPSRWPEPFGMVGLEAMRYGRPVVGFDVGGIPDWLEHETTGLLVREQDVDALARSLARVLTEDGLAAKLGANARRRVAERFGFARYVDQLEHYLSGPE